MQGDHVAAVLQLLAATSGPRVQPISPALADIVAAKGWRNVHHADSCDMPSNTLHPSAQWSHRRCAETLRSIG